MRRLTEILAFPKAWYRRSIVRRLFLGDLSSSAAYPESDCNSPSNEEDAAMGSSLLRRSEKHGIDMHVKSIPERSPTMNKDKLRLTLESEVPKHTRIKGLL